MNNLAEKGERIVAIETSLASMTEENQTRDDKIETLEKKIDELAIINRENEKKINTYNHISLLLERKADDQEQISRKVNLRINGIELSVGETPDSLLGLIKTECTKLNLNLSDADFDHCHRNGKIVTDGDVRTQTVLLKMRSWRGRNIIYEKRGEFPFKVRHDLTFRRMNVLKDANEFASSPDSKNFLEYALADKNCKLKVKSSNGRYYHVNSIEEVRALAMKLQMEAMGSEYANDATDELFR